MRRRSFSGRRPSQRAQRRRRTRLRALAALAAVVGLAALCVALALIVGNHRTPAESIAFIPPSVPDADGALLETVSVAMSQGVYPYSVIPGGVHSAAEFSAKRTSDPVVAKHYSDVSVSTLHVEQVSDTRSAYMSYRIDDRVYWTKNRLPLRAGEVILTDGETTIRGRCGNRVSETPMTPVSDEEPAAAAFDRRIDGPTMTAVAGISDSRDDDTATNVGSGMPDVWPGLAASGNSRLQARTDGPLAGSGSGGAGGFGGGGVPFESSNPNGDAPGNSTRGSSSTSPDDSDSTPPGGGGGSTSPGGSGGSSPPGGSGGSNPPGGDWGSIAPVGGGFGDTPGSDDPFLPGDLPGDDMPPLIVGGTPSSGNAPLSVPEPSSVLLLVGGLAGHALSRIRSRRRRN